MNDMQKKFFKHIADIQETCVEICLSKHKKYNDNEARAMLYNITYEFAVEIMEMIDGYSEYSHDKHDIINTVTGEHLKENPSIELHDQLDGIMKSKISENYGKLFKIKSVIEFDNFRFVNLPF